MEIRFITSNKKKFEEAQHILKDWQLVHVDLDLEELQGPRQLVIVKKAEAALARLGCPLIVEDVSLHLACLNGFPGPYIKDFLTAVGEEGLYRLVHRHEDHSAQCVCLAAFIEPGRPPVVTEGVLEGTIVAPKGEVRHGKVSFNPIFQPHGCPHTFGEMSIEEHATFSHRRLAFDALRHQLHHREER